MQDVRNRKHIALVEEDDSDLLELPDLMDDSDSDFRKLAKYAMRQRNFPLERPFQKTTKIPSSKNTFDIQFVKRPTASQPDPIMPSDEPVGAINLPSTQQLPPSAMRLNPPTPSKRFSVNLGKRILLQEFEKVSQPVVSPFDRTLSFSNFGLNLPEAHSTPQCPIANPLKHPLNLPELPTINKENVVTPVAACSNLAIHINLNSPQKQQPHILSSVDGIQCIPTAPSPSPLPRPALSDLVESVRTPPRDLVQSPVSGSPSSRLPAPHFSPTTPRRQSIPFALPLTPKEQFLELLNNKLIERSLNKAPAPPIAQPTPPRIRSVAVALEIPSQVQQNAVELEANEQPLKVVEPSKPNASPLESVSSDRQARHADSPSRFVRNYVRNAQQSDKITDNSPRTIQKLHETFSQINPNRNSTFKPHGTFVAPKTVRRTRRPNEDVIAYLELDKTINQNKKSGNQRRFLYSKGDSLTEQENDSTEHRQTTSKRTFHTSKSTETSQPKRKSRKISGNQQRIERKSAKSGASVRNEEYSMTSDEDTNQNAPKIHAHDIGEFIEGSQPPETAPKIHTSAAAAAKAKNQSKKRQNSPGGSSSEDLLDSLYLETSLESKESNTKVVTVQHRNISRSSRIITTRSESNTSFEFPPPTPSKQVTRPQLSQDELEEQMILAFKANRELRRSNAVVSSQPITDNEIRKSIKRKSNSLLVSTNVQRRDRNRRIVASYSGASSDDDDQIVAFKPRNRLRRTNEDDAGGGDDVNVSERKNRKSKPINKSYGDDRQRPLSERKSSASNNACFDQTSKTIYKSMNMSIMTSPLRFTLSPNPATTESHRPPTQQSMYDPEDIDETICETQTQHASPVSKQLKPNETISSDQLVSHKKLHKEKSRPREASDESDEGIEVILHEKPNGKQKSNENNIEFNLKSISKPNEKHVDEVDSSSKTKPQAKPEIKTQKLAVVLKRMNIANQMKYSSKNQIIDNDQEQTTSNDARSKSRKRPRPTLDSNSNESDAPLSMLPKQFKTVTVALKKMHMDAPKLSPPKPNKRDKQNNKKTTAIESYSDVFSHSSPTVSPHSTTSKDPSISEPRAVSQQALAKPKEKESQKSIVQFIPETESRADKLQQETLSNVEYTAGERKRTKGKPRSKQAKGSDSESETKALSKTAPNKEYTARERQKTKGKPKSKQTKVSESESSSEALPANIHMSINKIVAEWESESSNASLVKQRTKQTTMPLANSQESETLLGKKCARNKYRQQLTSDSDSDSSHDSIEKQYTQNVHRSKQPTVFEAPPRFKLSNGQNKSKGKPRSKQQTMSDSESEHSSGPAQQNSKNKAENLNAPMEKLKLNGRPKIKQIKVSKSTYRPKPRSKQTAVLDSESEDSKLTPAVNNKSSSNQNAVVLQMTLPKHLSRQITVSDSESDQQTNLKSHKNTVSESHRPKTTGKPKSKQAAAASKSQGKPKSKHNLPAESEQYLSRQDAIIESDTETSQIYTNEEDLQLENDFDHQQMSTVKSSHKQTIQSSDSDSESDCPPMSPPQSLTTNIKKETRSRKPSKNIPATSVGNKKKAASISKLVEKSKPNKMPAKYKNKNEVPTITATRKTNEPHHKPPQSPVFDPEQSESETDVIALPKKTTGKPKSLQSPKDRDSDSELSNTSDVFERTFKQARLSQHSNPRSKPKTKGRPKSKKTNKNHQSDSGTDRTDESFDSDPEISQKEPVNATNDTPMSALAYKEASYCIPVPSNGGLRHSSRCGRNTSSSSDEDDPAQHTHIVCAMVHNENTPKDYAASVTPVRNDRFRKRTTSPSIVADNSDATFQSCESDDKTMDDPTFVDPTGSSVATTSKVSNSTADGAKRKKKRKNMLATLPKMGRRKCLQPTLYRAAPSDPAELEKYPNIRRSSRVKQHPTKFWLNDAPPLSPLLVYFSQKGDRQTQPKPKKKNANNSSTVSNSTNNTKTSLARVGSGFMADMLSGSFTNQARGGAIMIMSDDITISKKGNMICYDNDSVEYWYYATQVDCSRGYMKFKKDSQKKRCRTLEDLEILVCFGTVTITHNKITEDVSCGDLVVIKSGTKYSIRNNLEEMALIFFSKNPSSTPVG